MVTGLFAVRNRQ